LTESDVVVIRQLHANGAKQIDLASRFNCTQATISSITRGKAWASVDGVLTHHKVARVDIDGSEASIKDLALKYGIPYTALRKRLLKGWDLSRAITQPIKKGYRRCTSPI